MQTKNISVTGSCGFIGHNVVRILSEQGHTVHGADSHTSYGFIPEAELAYLKESRETASGYKSWQADIVSPYTANGVAMDGSDVVIHLASFPRQKVVNDNPIEASRTMITGLIHLLESAVRYQVKRFVYISSSMVYGNFQDGVTEDAVCDPQGQYAIMKYAGEKLVEDYYRRHGLEYVIIRPSAVYGERDVNDRVASKFAISALKGGDLLVRGANERLDFTHVDDTAMGIAQAAVSTSSANKIYNLTRSNQHTLTLLEAAELMTKLAGSGTIKVEDRDMNFPSRGRLSIDRARQDFEYDPKIDANEGFTRYLSWFQSSKYWRSQIYGY